MMSYVFDGSFGYSAQFDSSRLFFWIFHSSLVLVVRSCFFYRLFGSFYRLFGSLLLLPCSERLSELGIAFYRKSPPSPAPAEQGLLNTRSIEGH
jgi:hypothetical protein